jgi:hypothetical protein
MINKFMWPHTEGDKWVFLGLDCVGLTLIVSVFSIYFLHGSFFVFVFGKLYISFIFYGF